MIKLSKKDIELIYYLDENARYTTSDLARKIGISQSNVIYRMNRLIENKIIDEFYVLLNPFAFKERYDRLIVNFRSDWDMDKIREYCKNNKYIGWYMFVDGKWNFGCQIWSDDILKTRKTVQEFLSEFSQYINDYTVSSLISIEKFEHEFLFSKTHRKRTKLSIVPRRNLDEMDKNIIMLIFRNARMKLVDIASALNTDYKTISYRLKRLERSNVIVSYKAKINRFNLGYDYYKIRLAFASYSKEDVKSVKEFLLGDKRILFVTEALGWADMEFEIFCKNQHEYREFQNNFKRRFANVVKEFETLIPFEFNWNHYIPEK